MSLRDAAIHGARRYLRPGVRAWVVRQQRRYNIHWLRVGSIQFGDLYRTTPVSAIFGIGRRLGRDGWGEYWRITTQSAERLFADTFAGAEIQVGSYGNVLAACCCLHGIVSEEVAPADLDYHDRDFEVVVTVRARKAV